LMQCRVDLQHDGFGGLGLGLEGDGHEECLEYLNTIPTLSTVGLSLK
jgi:hypothetical protein